MLKENWQVWFAYDLEGSYEESPQDTDRKRAARPPLVPGQFAARHGAVRARIARHRAGIHLLLGIFGYLASPLWLAFLLTYNWMRLVQEYTGLSDITVRSFMPFID